MIQLLLLHSTWLYILPYFNNLKICKQFLELYLTWKNEEKQSQTEASREANFLQVVEHKTRMLVK